MFLYLNINNRRYPYLFTSTQINGVITQSENIADNAGFRIAYQAYDAWIQQNNITEDHPPGLDYNPRQLFWISAASIWCNTETTESLKSTVATDNHSPARSRVLTSFSNIKEFSEDFKCTIGSKMNPENKCIVW